MIFQPKLANKILQGKKTQTRRVVKYAAADDSAGLPARGQRVVHVDQKHDGPKVLVPCAYRVGNDYSLQLGRGKPAQPGVRLLVTSVSDEPEHLGAIAFEDARREGFRTRDEFFDYWRALHGGLDPDVLVWVITFAPKFEERFLPGRVGQGEPTGRPDPHTGERSTDYVHGSYGSLSDGGEAIPEGEQDVQTAEAHERFAQHQASDTLEKRLAVCRREARAKGIDPTRLEKSIQRRIEAYEKLVRSAA